MIFFLKAIIIGIAKIIPGVSGAMLAINFNLYERLLNALTSFFDDFKNNLKFLLIFSTGILISLIVFSNVIMFLLNKYFFLTMMFFIGLILGGTYKFSFNIRYNYKSILLIIFSFLIVFFLGISNLNNNYIIHNNFLDNIFFFIGGIIEILASIIPGISATSLLMIIGIYDDVLNMISNIFNFNYVLDNINLYLSYGIGMFFSLVVSISLINYFILRYKNASYSIILGLSIASIILLFLITINTYKNILILLLGIILLIIGVIIAWFLSD